MSRFDRGPSAGTPAAAQTTPQAARPRLDVYDGDALVETIRLTEGSHCLGRDTDACDLPLEHASCSRRHARLAVDARGGVLIEDLGSAQGTFLDGASTPLAALERVRLKEGASVTFAAGPAAALRRTGPVLRRRLRPRQRRRRPRRPSTPTRSARSSGAPRRRTPSRSGARPPGLWAARGATSSSSCWAARSTGPPQKSARPIPRERTIWKDSTSPRVDGAARGIGKG